MERKSSNNVSKERESFFISPVIPGCGESFVYYNHKKIPNLGLGCAHLQSHRRHSSSCTKFIRAASKICFRFLHVILKNIAHIFTYFGSRFLHCTLAANVNIPRLTLNLVSCVFAENRDDHGLLTWNLLSFSNGFHKWSEVLQCHHWTSNITCAILRKSDLSLSTSKSYLYWPCLLQCSRETCHQDFTLSHSYEKASL